MFGTLHPTHPAVLGCAVLALLLGGLCRVAGAEVEVRDFLTSIDGNRAGDYRMTITREEDGTVSMAGQADIIVRRVVVVYRYSFRGNELWKNGRLQRLESTSNDNGKAFSVSATATEEGLRVQVNGRERLVRSNVWTMTYWQLPPAKIREQTLTLLDADTGKSYSGTLQYVGAQQLGVAGQSQECAHYRVTAANGPQADLWYDNQERLVRQEWVEDGHRAVLELVRVQR